MGTIAARARKDGSIGYTAQIVVRRGGRTVASQAQTFDDRNLAQIWLASNEPKLRAADQNAVRGEPTVGDLITKTLTVQQNNLGRTKSQVLRASLGHNIAKIPLTSLSATDLVSFARTLGKTRKPQTVQNYLSHLSNLLDRAPTVDANLTRQALRSARHGGLVAKSAKRHRRPSLEELDRLMQYFAQRSERCAALPMHRVIAFALFSTRRQDEIVRLTWADLEPGRLQLRPATAAAPGTWCSLPPEAERLALAMPVTGARIFPYSADAISAAFTRACKVLAIDDLHFQDLRNEGIARLFDLGWQIPQVAAVSGHRTWASLQRFATQPPAGDRYAQWPWLADLSKAAA